MWLLMIDRHITPSLILFLLFLRKKNRTKKERMVIPFWAWQSKKIFFSQKTTTHHNITTKLTLIRIKIVLGIEHLNLNKLILAIFTDYSRSSHKWPPWKFEKVVVTIELVAYQIVSDCMLKQWRVVAYTSASKIH